MFKPTPTLLADFYKISHRIQYPQGTEYVYSNFTPRSDNYFKGKDSDLYDNKLVWFGTQYYLKHVLIDLFNEEFFHKPLWIVLEQYKRIVENCLGKKNVDTSHIEDLYSLGYLPLHIKALPEGTILGYKVPCLTVINTDPRFYWLTNFIETSLSCNLWMLSNNASIAYEYKKICKHYSDLTCDNEEHLPFQLHDFSMRGMPTHEAAIASGMAHLLSSVGTDTVPAINALEYYYNADITKELVGCSIPATEHAVSCTNILTIEESLKKDGKYKEYSLEDYA